MNSESSRIIEFLSRPVPTYTTLEAWRAECRELGNLAPGVFLRSLEQGSDTGHEQEKALLGLEVFGYGAYEDGEPETPDFQYQVRRPGETEWFVIKPRIIHRDLFAEAFEEFRRHVSNNS